MGDKNTNALTSKYLEREIITVLLKISKRMTTSMRTRTYTSVGDKNTEVFEYDYDYFIERKIISGVKNESNDEGTGHMRKRDS